MSATAPTRVGVVACGALAVHVRAIAKRRGWALDVHPLDATLHNRPERIAPAVQTLTDRLAEGARQRGYQVLGERTPENGAGIIALHKPNVDSRKVVKDLKERGIIATPRQGWVRFSPHFYISPEEIDRVIEALP